VVPLPSGAKELRTSRHTNQLGSVLSRGKEVIVVATRKKAAKKKTAKKKAAKKKKVAKKK
jgi:hypothetical protein